MRLRALVSLAFVLRAAVASAGVSADAPTTLPSTAPAGVSASLWQQMQSIDAAAATVHDLSADFTQSKFTPLLKRPMVSTGTVLAQGDRTLWTTASPQATQMAVGPKQIVLYYPQQHAAEIYPLSGVLAQLSASPIPRLAELLQQFTIRAGDEHALPLTDQDPQAVTFELTPTTPDLQQHVQRVSVVIDARRGLILLLRLVDSDGEATDLRFSNLKPNTGLSDRLLELPLPAGTAITHPLDNLGGGLP